MIFEGTLFVSEQSARIRAVTAGSLVTTVAGGGAFGTRAALNGATLPPAVDVRAGDPHVFLDGIVQPPVRGTAAGGVQLPPLSTTFLCYGA